MRSFIEFIRSRGIIGFAVGFIAGKAVSDLVGSFVADIINPVIGLLTSRIGDLSKISVWVFSAEIRYGNLISTFINFAIIMLVVYLIFKVSPLGKLDDADKK